MTMNVLHDDGYLDDNFQYPVAYPEQSGLLKAISQLHETFNNILKRWKVLSTPFRHRPFTSEHKKSSSRIINTENGFTAAPGPH
jgi:hypothetical protein